MRGTRPALGKVIEIGTESRRERVDL